MRQLRLEVDPKLCVGSGTCELIAPELFSVDSDGKSHPAVETAGETPELIEAVESCPTGAIKAVDPSTGAVIHPSW